LWGIDVYSGDVRWSIGSGDPATFGYGRGLLAGDSAYWPKRDEIFVVDYRNGQITRRIPLTQVHDVSGGNLTISNGMLLIAEPERLVAFGTESRLKSTVADKNPAKGQ
jgi:outer membrane protein assembly factor BamB